MSVIRGLCPRGHVLFDRKKYQKLPTDVSACDGIGSGILIPLYRSLPGKPKITFQLP